MEEHEFLFSPTLLELAVQVGLSASLLTSKKKLRQLLAGKDALPLHLSSVHSKEPTIRTLAAEAPPDSFVDALGPTGGIYSADINLWLLRAARRVINQCNPDVMYVSTTDFVQHKYAPEDEVAIRHTGAIDTMIGHIIADDPKREVYITADHGMRQMDQGIDLVRLLSEGGVEALFQPIIKDRHTVHHNNLAGVAYLYLESEPERERAIEVLQGIPEVDSVYRREEACRVFGLHPERIGDLFVLGVPGVVFGEFDTVRAPVNVRSHGSRHESTVPIYGYNASIAKEQIRMNLDITRLLTWRLVEGVGTGPPNRAAYRIFRGR